MSGDVQPRKRKDKKRRKDEGEQIPIQTHAPSNTNSPSDDVNIHVHKEGGTGGGICAKLVFFVLLSALVVVLGMIITQYRGLTDVETVDTESRFSQIFEGWIDASPDHHDDHDIEEPLDDHDLDHDEEDDEQNASEDDEDEEEEHEPSEEEEDDEDEDENEDAEVSEERSEIDEEDDNDNQDEDEEQAVEDSEEHQLDEDEDEDEEDEPVQASEEERDVYESEEKDDDDDEDGEDHDEDEQELENIDSEEDKDEDDDDDDAIDEVSTIRKSGENNEDQDANDDEEDEEDTKPRKASDSASKISKDVVDDGTPIEEKQQERSVAVKLGVGVALLVVAHLVLVRKWRNAPEDKPKPPKEEPSESTPDLSRRNTIVMPPTFQEVEPDIEPEEEDYSEEEEELSEEEVHENKSAKARYQELRSTYTRSLTPEGEIDSHKPSETYDDEYEENVDDEEDEELSEEEEEDEEEDDKREGESEEEEQDEEYDEDEDEELLKRLEAKYGKLRREGAAERQADVENSDSEKSEDDGYQFSNITNKDDYKIKSDIDEAQKSVQNNLAYAIKLFDKILQKYPSSPRSIYGKALALDYLADQRRSNEILQQALNFYIQLLNTENVPKALFEMAAERCLTRMRFVGQYRNAINVHKLVIQKFPNNPKHSNDLAVTYLTINRIEEARSVLKEILEKWPNDGYALVHYGFILKTADNKLEKAVKYLQRGLETRTEGVVDGRFYFHLGDALARLGQNEKAMKVYEEGVENNVFLSKYQRSLYNVPRLTGKPWWDLSDLPYLDLFRLLKQNWKKIRDEGLAALNEKGYFQDESENLKDTGDWKQFELFARGQKNLNNCRVCPFTCSIIERIPEAKGCKRGQTKFSVMHPTTHVWPHCGPTNCRLRAHLGLKVPPGTFIRVADETKSWEEGELFVFDDSFEHEVWHNGTEFRLVLIVDVWHPELTAAEKRSLSPI